VKEKEDRKKLFRTAQIQLRNWYNLSHYTLSLSFFEKRFDD